MIQIDILYLFYYLFCIFNSSKSAEADLKLGVFYFERNMNVPLVEGTDVIVLFVLKCNPVIIQFLYIFKSYSFRNE